MITSPFLLKNSQETLVYMTWYFLDSTLLLHGLYGNLFSLSWPFYVAFPQSSLIYALFHDSLYMFYMSNQIYCDGSKYIYIFMTQKLILNLSRETESI